MRDATRRAMEQRAVGRRKRSKRWPPCTPSIRKPSRRSVINPCGTASRRRWPWTRRATHALPMMWWWMGAARTTTPPTRPKRMYGMSARGAGYDGTCSRSHRRCCTALTGWKVWSMVCSTASPHRGCAGRDRSGVGSCSRWPMPRCTSSMQCTLGMWCPPRAPNDRQLAPCSSLERVRLLFRCGAAGRVW